MQTSPFSRGHEQTMLCRQGTARRKQHMAAERAAQAMGETFTAYGIELEQVEVFKYLGRLVSYDDNDARAVRHNLRKAMRSWARLSRVLRAENASPRVNGLFYKATIQAILLFGSETWNLSPSAMKCLEGFHVRAARRMTGLQPRREPDGTWTYQSSEKVLEAAGLHTIQHYVEVRRNTVLKFILDRPIFEFCREASRQRGTSNRQYWWEQSLDLEAARAAVFTAAGVAVDEGDDGDGAAGP